MEILAEQLSERYKKARTILFIEYVLRGFCGISGFFAGSRAEGPHSSDSDTDFKYVSKDINALAAGTKCTRQNKSTVCVMTESEDCYPGYVKLQVINDCHTSHLIELTGYSQRIKAVCVKGSTCLSTVKVLQFWTELAFKILPNLGVIKRRKVHGPCIQPTYIHCKEEFDIDILYCIPCQSWPIEAEEWPRRCTTRDWPGCALTQAIVSKGCYFVPIGSSTKSSDTETEWRISFSLAERELIWSLAGTQLLCYDLLKLLHQRLKKTYSGLESYFWKTALFWILEQTDKVSWTAKSVLNRVVDCVLWLSNAIKTKTCPNYFIPANNMLEGKFLDESIEVNLVSLLEEIADPGHSIWKELGEQRSADIRDDMLYKHHIYLNTLAVSIHFLFYFIKEPSPAVARRRLIEAKVSLLSQKKTKDFDELAFLLANHLDMYITTLEIAETMTNGNPVPVARVVNDLTQPDSPGLSLDLFSNKLKIASIFFTNGHYEETLKLVQDVANSYGPHIVHFTSFIVSRNPLYRKYPQQACTLADFATKYLALDLSFLYAEMALAPPAIKFQMADGNTAFINPLVFAFYLEFLAYWRKGHSDSALLALDKLHALIKDEEKSSSSYVALEILAQSYAVCGKLEDAFKLLLEARKVRDVGKTNDWLCAIVLWTAFNLKSEYKDLSCM